MIKDGFVDNISIWDGVSEWMPEGYTLYDISDMPEIVAGYGYDGINFIPPDPQEAPIEAPAKQLIEESAPQIADDTPSIAAAPPKQGFWAKLFS